MDPLQVLDVLAEAAAAVRVCWKRDALDHGAPLLAPLEGERQGFLLRAWKGCQG